MISARQVADADRANAEPFGGTCHATYRDDIASVHGIFYLNKHPGNNVLHQLLRAKTNRQTEYTSTGDQRADIDADFRQHNHAGNRHHGDGQRITEQTKQRFRPRGRFTIAGFRVEFMLNQARQPQPNR